VTGDIAHCGLEYSYWAIVEKAQVYCNHLPGQSGYNKVVAIDLEYLGTLQDMDKYSKSIATTLLQPLGPCHLPR